ncbi:hypothetical protein ACN4EE_06330 [Geminocystis sp. CENA526]|uniref:hypothetical protein n=1 Tax=Geminocystis sp. CENA526 TaxID=1355871 RepID=UPI003D6FB314
MKLKAIKEGYSLKITEKLNLADGEEIVISISDYQLQNSKSSITWDDFQEVIGAWTEDENITEVFKEIDQQRHKDLGREVNL